MLSFVECVWCSVSMKLCFYVQTLRVMLVEEGFTMVWDETQGRSHYKMVRTKSVLYIILLHLSCVASSENYLGNFFIYH